MFSVFMLNGRCWSKILCLTVSSKNIIILSLSDPGCRIMHLCMHYHGLSLKANFSLIGCGVSGLTTDMIPSVSHETGYKPIRSADRWMELHHRGLRGWFQTDHKCLKWLVWKSDSIEELKGIPSFFLIILELFLSLSLCQRSTVEIYPQ